MVVLRQCKRTPDDKKKSYSPPALFEAGLGKKINRQENSPATIKMLN